MKQKTDEKIEKINKAKSWFFQKISKTDKLARLIKNKMKYKSYIYTRVLVYEN